MSLGVFIGPSLRHGNIDIAIAAEQIIFGLSILLRSGYRDDENSDVGLKEGNPAMVRPQKLFCFGCDSLGGLSQYIMYVPCEPVGMARSVVCRLG